MKEVTQILEDISHGQSHRAEELLPLVYEELRKLAAARMAGEQPDHTLQPTALVHEAYVRLVDVDNVQRWNNRGHFFAAAAESMRRILIESARRKQTDKHGGDWQQVDQGPVEIAAPADAERWLLLNDALTRFEQLDAVATQVAKLRLFAGLSIEQAGEALNLSRATAFRHWTYARAWLQAQLQENE